MPIFYIVNKSKPEQFQFVERFDGTLAEARKVIKKSNYDEGIYLILHDTSGDVIKTIVREETVTVDFKPTRTRKAKS